MAVICTYREIQRETYMQAYMQTGMHAVRAMHAETDIETYISDMQLQSVRQAYTSSQTARCTHVHAYTGRYRQRGPMQAATCRH